MSIDEQIGTPDEYFPGSIVAQIAESLGDFLPEHSIALRPLRQTDPNRSIGIYSANWTPVADSAMIGQQEAPLARYTIRVQNMIKAMDEAEGRAAFTLEAKAIRAILYRNTDLRVRLAGLQEELLSTVERVKRYGVVKQDFITNELSGVFVFLASTELFVETETTAIGI